MQDKVLLTAKSMSTQQHTGAAGSRTLDIIKSGTSDKHNGGAAVSHTRAAAATSSFHRMTKFASTGIATVPSADSTKTHATAQQRHGGGKTLLPKAAVPADMATAMDIDCHTVPSSSGQQAGSQGRPLPFEAAAKGQSPSRAPIHTHRTNLPAGTSGRRKQTLEVRS